MTDCFIVLYNVCNSCNHGNKSLVPGLAVRCILAKITDHTKKSRQINPRKYPHPLVGNGRLVDGRNTKFLCLIKRGFVKAAISKAVRLRGCSA